MRARSQLDKECREYGRTALGYAAYYGSLDCLQVLGSAGADPFHEDLEGFTVLVGVQGSGRQRAGGKAALGRGRMRGRRGACWWTCLDAACQWRGGAG